MLLIRILIVFNIFCCNLAVFYAWIIADFIFVVCKFFMLFLSQVCLKGVKLMVTRLFICWFWWIVFQQLNPKPLAHLTCLGYSTTDRQWPLKAKLEFSFLLAEKTFVFIASRHNFCEPLGCSGLCCST